jgi:hypothetical protein
MRRKTKRFIIPLAALVALLAGLDSSYAAREQKISAPQKRRVIARGQLTGTREVFQVVTWQTLNPPSSNKPYAQAHLAVETAGRNPRVMWQTDGGDEQYLVNSVRLVDMDGDRVPEIASLWWVGASAGAALRVFHWDRDKQEFIELHSEDDLMGVHRYSVVRKGKEKHLVIYVRSETGAGWPAVAGGRLRLHSSKLVRVQPTLNKTGAGLISTSSSMFSAAGS